METSARSAQGNGPAPGAAGGGGLRVERSPRGDAARARIGPSLGRSDRKRGARRPAKRSRRSRRRRRGSRAERRICHLPFAIYHLPFSGVPAASGGLLEPLEHDAGLVRRVGPRSGSAAVAARRFAPGTVSAQELSRDTLALRTTGAGLLVRARGRSRARELSRDTLALRTTGAACSRFPPGVGPGGQAARRRCRETRVGSGRPGQAPRGSRPGQVQGAGNAHEVPRERVGSGRAGQRSACECGAGGRATCSAFTRCPRLSSRADPLAHRKKMANGK
jgi:hypothetical protein